MSKAGEFTTDQVVAGLSAIGYNTENRLKVLEYRDDFLGTTSEIALARCRDLVIKVQGADAGKSNTPVSLERYRKRVDRMFGMLAKSFKDLHPDQAAMPMTAPVTEQSSKPENSSPMPVDAGAPVPDNGSATSEPTNADPGTADTTKETEMAAKKKTPKPPKAPKEKKVKGPGVIDTIVSVLEAGGGTVADIAAKVHKKFPDRKLDGLTATVKIQVSRLQTPKKDGGRGLKIVREKQEGTNALSYSIKSK